MNGKHLKWFLALYLEICISIAFFAGCNQIQESAHSLSMRLYPSAPEFEAFYNKAGGEEVLGEFISPRLEEGKYVYQYTVNALLRSELWVEGDRYTHFAPIGLDLNLLPYQNLWKHREGFPESNSIPIYQEFLPMYDRIGGEERIGAPLSGLRYNPLKKRYEQYFEGVGIYRAESDPIGNVKLMAYGAWKCGNACLYPVSTQAEVIPPMAIDPRVLPLVQGLGLDFTGFALSPAILDSDGKQIVIFENVVIEIQSNSEGGVSLSPLPQRLGILPQGIVHKQDDQNKIFLSLDGDKGYHILRSFLDYIGARGGLDLTGLPIGEPMEWENGSIRQCFEKVCLIEDPKLGGMYRVRPYPLGFAYASLYFEPKDGENSVSISPKEEQPPSVEGSSDKGESYPEVTLEILETKPFVDDQTSQGIGVIVRFDSQPGVGVLPKLYLSLSNGESYEFEMPATDEQGKSYMVIPPIQAPNGSLVVYRICITTQSGLQVCARDDYLIWTP